MFPPSVNCICYCICNWENKTISVLDNNSICGGDSAGLPVLSLGGFVGIAWTMIE
jgi:RAB protein geranylgeranyltransferase component A